MLLFLLKKNNNSNSNFWKHRHSSSSPSHGARWKTKNFILFRWISERQLSVRDRQKSESSFVARGIHLQPCSAAELLGLQWDRLPECFKGWGRARGSSRRSLQTRTEDVFWHRFVAKMNRFQHQRSEDHNKFATPVWLSCCPFFFFSPP